MLLFLQILLLQLQLLVHIKDLISIRIILGICDLCMHFNLPKTHCKFYVRNLNYPTYSIEIYSKILQVLSFYYLTTCKSSSNLKNSNQVRVQWSSRIEMVVLLFKISNRYVVEHPKRLVVFHELEVRALVSFHKFSTRLNSFGLGE